MNKRFWSFLLSSLLLFVICGNWISVKAQAPSDIQGRCSSLSEPVAIALPAGSELDAQTYRPRGRQQSYRPCEDTQAIIGSDERLPVLSRLFPWLALGRLEWAGSEARPGGICTGTLVGWDLVLTNAHCLEAAMIAQQTEQPKILFRPNLSRNSSPRYLNPPNQDYANVAGYRFGENYFNGDPSDDWAIFKLDRSLGDAYGYLGWQVLDFSDEQIRTALENQIVLPGYSGDYPTEGLGETLGQRTTTAGVHVGCRIDGLSENLGIYLDEEEIGHYSSDGRVTGKIIVHQCDTTGGASGSPILAYFDDGNYYIIGLHARRIPFEEVNACEAIQQSDGSFANRGTCRNGAVQVSRWSAQAAVMRGSN